MKLKDLKGIISENEDILINSFKMHEELGQVEFYGIFEYVPERLLEKEVITLTTTIDIGAINEGDSIAFRGGNAHIYMTINVLDEE